MKKYNMRLAVHDADAEPGTKSEVYIEFDGITASQMQTAVGLMNEQLDDLIRGLQQPCAKEDT